MSDTPRVDRARKQGGGAGRFVTLAEELERDLAAETEIVNRIWAIYGSPSYEELQGRSIYDLINADRAALAAANARAEQYRVALQDVLDCAEAEATAKISADVAVDNFSFPEQEVDRYQKAAIASSNAASRARKLLDAAIAAREKLNE